MRLPILLTTVLASGGLPAISVSPSSWDFGATPVGTPVSKEFEITNTGTATLQITLPITSDNAAFTITAQPGSTSLAPGDSTTFTARYSGALPQAYSGNLSIVSNAASSPTVIAVTATSDYATRVLATSPQRYNKLNEGSGLTLIDSSVNAFTGSAVGITWDAGQSPPMLGSVPFFDGTNDYGNLYSASFATAFNLDEFTIMVWFKMNSVNVWTDATARYMLRIRRDGNNYVEINKNNTNNNLQLTRVGNATSKQVSAGSQSDTAWVCLALSASIAGGGLLAAGELRAYKNGVQLGSTMTANVASAGTGLSATQTVLGAASTTPLSVHHGWLSHLIIWNRPIDTAILALMTV